MPRIVITRVAQKSDFLRGTGGAAAIATATAATATAGTAATAAILLK